MTRSAARESTAVGTLLRAAATLSVVMIVLQGVSAGQILSRHPAGEALHFGGAIVVHVLTALTTLAAFLVMRRTGGPWWPTVVSAAVFLLGFVQATLGEAGNLMVHVPLAMLLLVAAATVMVWSFRPVRA